MRYIKVNDVGTVTHLAEYSADKMLVCAKFATVLLDKKTLEISPLYPRPKHYRHYHYSDPYYSSGVNVPEDSNFILQGAIYGITDKANTVHAITYGNGYQTFSKQSDTIVHVTYNVERYEKISFSKALNKFFIYSDKVVTIGKDSLLTHIDEAMLSAAGINRVEEIVFDERYGNLFIKDLEKLFLFNIYTCRFRQVFRRYNLEQTQIAVHNNILVLANRNGVAFSEITGRGEISKPTRYTNTKALAYKTCMILSLREGKYY
ncbi:MAG: hypothetical protein K8F30_00345, partial [Taibaiella sp.]|nr:hypothetical protein [Taibaiella sp.]